MENLGISERVLNFINENGMVTIKEIASFFNLPLNSINLCCKILADKKLISKVTIETYKPI